MRTRRHDHWLSLTCLCMALLLSLGVGAFSAPRKEPTVIVVHRTPTCNCCGKWEQHLRDSGFAVESHIAEDLSPVRSKLGVPAAVTSCHTAVVANLFVEGHVPAEIIVRLLRERPSGIIGIAVPGMPIGSPGMEGRVVEHYNILSIDASGKQSVYAQR